MIVISEELEHRAREVARTILRTPFLKRTWSELWFFAAGGALAFLGLAVVGITMVAGVVFAITFFGLALIGLSLAKRAGHRPDPATDGPDARRRVHRRPRTVHPRPGYLGWLQSALRDRTAWRSVAYVVVKVPLTFFGVAHCIQPVVRRLQLPRDALGRRSIPSSSGYLRPSSLRDGLTEGGAFLVGILLFFAAPWGVRFMVYLDRLLMRSLLGPDAMDIRLRSLERSRAQTVDASAATLRRIERDLHDGTQAQLVAVAMRLGMAKEKLADPDHVDLAQVSELVNDAHRGAKEAIVELRDLARGIHPPALDTGLEGALSTLAARSTVPTDLDAGAPRPSHAGDRVDRLLLCRRASGERGPARQGVASEHHLRTARALAPSGRARRRDGRSTTVEPGVVVKWIGRPGRPGRCGRRAIRHREPTPGTDGGHRRPSPARMTGPHSCCDRRGLGHLARRPGPAAGRPGFRDHRRRERPRCAAQSGRTGLPRRGHRRHPDAADASPTRDYGPPSTSAVLHEGSGHLDVLPIHRDPVRRPAVGRGRRRCRIPPERPCRRRG